MKQNISKVLALLLALSMVLPMTAFAASGRVYDVYVSISDKDSPAGPKTGTKVEDTLTMISGDAKMVEVLAQVVIAHYQKNPSEPDMYDFDSLAMKLQMDEGLRIAKDGGTKDPTAWRAYGEKYSDTWSCPYEAGLKAKLANYDTTVHEVGPGTHIVRHLNDVASDSKFGVTYTVTIIIRDHFHDNDDDDRDDRDDTRKPTIEIKDITPAVPAAGGKTTVDKPGAKPGETVKIITEPDRLSMVDHITITDEDGNRVSLSYDGEGVYEFKMPEKGTVEIDVKYRVIPADPGETGVSEILDTDDHRLYMIGDTTGNFNPNASIKRSEVATAFFRLLRNQDIARTLHFDDVKATNWYAQPVEVLAALGLVEGMGNGDYEPNRPITRAEFAMIASRFTKKHYSGVVFTDVREGAWYADAVSTAAHFGWIYGMGDGTFEPNRPITRTEAAAIINRMLMRISDWIDVDAGHGRHFPDVSDTFWGRYEISEATNDHDHTLEEKYYYEDWYGEEWRQTVDNDPVNFGQPKF